MNGTLLFPTYPIPPPALRRLPDTPSQHSGSPAGNSNQQQHEPGNGVRQRVVTLFRQLQAFCTPGSSSDRRASERTASALENARNAGEASSSAERDQVQSDDSDSSYTSESEYEESDDDGVGVNDPRSCIERVVDILASSLNYTFEDDPPPRAELGAALSLRQSQRWNEDDGRESRNSENTVPSN